MFMSLLFCVASCCTVVIQSNKANKLDITLCLEKRFPLIVLKGYLRNGHLLGKKLFCGASFLALSVLSFKMARAPPVLSHPHYTARGSTRFLVSLQCCSKSASVGLKLP